MAATQIPPGPLLARCSSAFASISGRVRRAFPRRVASILLNQSQYRVSEKYTGTHGERKLGPPGRTTGSMPDYASLNAHRGIEQIIIIMALVDHACMGHLA